MGLQGMDESFAILQEAFGNDNFVFGEDEQRDFYPTSEKPPKTPKARRKKSSTSRSRSRSRARREDEDDDGFTVISTISSNEKAGRRRSSIDGSSHNLSKLGSSEETHRVPRRGSLSSAMDDTVNHPSRNRTRSIDDGISAISFSVSSTASPSKRSTESSHSGKGSSHSRYRREGSGHRRGVKQENSGSSHSRRSGHRRDSSSAHSRSGHSRQRAIQELEDLGYLSPRKSDASYASSTATASTTSLTPSTPASDGHKLVRKTREVHRSMASWSPGKSSPSSGHRRSQEEGKVRRRSSTGGNDKQRSRSQSRSRKKSSEDEMIDTADQQRPKLRSWSSRSLSRPRMTEYDMEDGVPASPRKVNRAPSVKASRRSASVGGGRRSRRGSASGISQSSHSHAVRRGSAGGSGWGDAVSVGGDAHGRMARRGSAGGVSVGGEAHGRTPRRGSAGGTNGWGDMASSSHSQGGFMKETRRNSAGGGLCGDTTSSHRRGAAVGGGWPDLGASNHSKQQRRGSTGSGAGCWENSSLFATGSTVNRRGSTGTASPMYDFDDGFSSGFSFRKQRDASSVVSSMSEHGRTPRRKSGTGSSSSGHFHRRPSLGYRASGKITDWAAPVKRNPSGNSRRLHRASSGVGESSDSGRLTRATSSEESRKSHSLQRTSSNVSSCSSSLGGTSFHGCSDEDPMAKPAADLQSLRKGKRRTASSVCG